MKSIKGFSKLTKEAKIEWLISNYADDPEKALALIKSYWNTDSGVQKLHDEFIENTITNFYLPYGVAPNFLINGKVYCIPMATEESSVVAACAKAANYWLTRGGFKTTVTDMSKRGHVHFLWEGKNSADLFAFFENIKQKFFDGTASITKNMRARGGGIKDIILVDKTAVKENYYQLRATFDTCDSMGANFINSVLEEFAAILEQEISITTLLPKDEMQLEIIMRILSNYTPDCIVHCEVSCPVEEMNEDSTISAEDFVKKFITAVNIAEVEPYRAVTHNKGIMNGIDSVVVATGNDFRAVEASAHAYASHKGTYSSLTHAEIKDGIFRFYIDVPLALGTVGGITNLHPLVKFSHEILGNPNAKELMMIVAAAGLAQNFSAIRSLVTTGIQKGHMKMHLLNILNQLEATENEKKQIVESFKNKTVSYNAAVDAFTKLRGEANIKNNKS
ncbi:MAG: hydroxymethylglutaryl-CoA reductase, degradative [Bacteroidia bacterium]|nr:hydroxymethylglutaryl-CoA reductase, degradative [Bacteroidia bacterium]